MTVPHVTAAYAALLGLFFVYLSVRALQARRAAGVALGDGGNQWLQRRVRVHANFAEYAPMGVLLLALAELLGAHVALLHVLGSSLLLGRLTHAYGVTQENERFAYRVAGMGMTLTSICASSLLVLVLR